MLTSFEEIAEEIGVTPEGARRIYQRAMEKIRLHLQRNPDAAQELATYLQRGDWNLQCPKIPEETEPETD